SLSGGKAWARPRNFVCTVSRSARKDAFTAAADSFVRTSCALAGAGAMTKVIAASASQATTRRLSDGDIKEGKTGIDSSFPKSYSRQVYMRHDVDLKLVNWQTFEGTAVIYRKRADGDG